MFLAVLEAALHKSAKDAVPKSIRRGIRGSIKQNLCTPPLVWALALGGHEAARAVQEHVHGDCDRERLRSEVLDEKAVQRLLMQEHFREFVLAIYRMNRAGRSGYELVRYPGFVTGRGKEASAAERLKCVACADSERTHAFLPCGHLCTCNDCAGWILQCNDEAKCPCCRSRVESSLRVYLS
jgi:hypothetical protein